jgi:hypothetical protein
MAQYIGSQYYCRESKCRWGGKKSVSMRLSERDSSGTTRIYEAHKCRRHAVEAEYMRVMERIARRERSYEVAERSGSPKFIV